MIRLFKVSIPSSVIALFVSEAILIYSCYLLAAYWVRDMATDVFLIDDGGLWRIGLVTAVIVLGLYFNNLYEDFRIYGRILLLQQLCLVLGIAFLMQALMSYGSWDGLLPKWMMMAGSVLVLVVVPSWRILFASIVLKETGAQRILFLGSSPAVEEILAHMEVHPELGLATVGYLDSGGDSPCGLRGAQRLGAIEDLDTIIVEQKVDGLVVSMGERECLPVERLIDLRFSGLQIEEAAATYEALFSRVSTRELRPPQLILSAELDPRTSGATLQTILSMLLSLIGILVTLPLMAAIALALKFSGSGAALNRRRCIGLNGVAFTRFRFRSAIWLRRFYLDGLPQLFNVLRGDMLLVGPRPERPELVAVLERRIPYYSQRHSVKPGVTGWAQINQRRGDGIEDAIEQLEYDLYYIKNLSVSLDAYIVLDTVKAILFGRLLSY